LNPNDLLYHAERSEASPGVTMIYSEILHFVQYDIVLGKMLSKYSPQPHPAREQQRRSCERNRRCAANAAGIRQLAGADDIAAARAAVACLCAAGRVAAGASAACPTTAAWHIIPNAATRRRPG
jgi:hypothetical protein